MTAQDHQTILDIFNSNRIWFTIAFCALNGIGLVWMLFLWSGHLSGIWTARQRRRADRMAEEMGLQRCHFVGGCDTCLNLNRRCWVSMGGGGEGGTEEADYYVCEKCLPQRYEDFKSEVKFYESMKP